MPVFDCPDCDEPIDYETGDDEARCPNCRRWQPVPFDDEEDARRPRRRRPAKKAQDAAGVIIGGYICAVISLLFCPPGFGIAGLTCGIVAMNRGHTGNGIAIIVMSIIFAIVGMAVGAAIALKQ